MELTFRVAETPTAQERALDYLLELAGEAATESEVGAALDLPKTTTHVALRALVESGLAVEHRVGRTGLYSVDADDPLVKTLKTAQAIRRVQEVIRPVRSELDLVVLFGSGSRGETRRGSDLDLLIVTANDDVVLSELSRHQWLQPVVLTPAAHMKLIAEGGTFAHQTALGITIWERR